MSFTANPRAPKGEEKTEPTGPVTSDSLAAESMKSGGDFAANNPHAAAYSQKGSSSTFNTTDTSGATTLDPAPRAERREAAQAERADLRAKGVTGLKYPEGAGGQGSEEGKAGATTGTTVQGQNIESSTSHDKSSSGSSDTGTQGQNTESSTSSGDKPSSGSSGTGSQGRNIQSSTSRSDKPSGSSGTDSGSNATKNVDEAPTYAATAAGTLHTKDQMKPKGKNLKEVDSFDEGENASMTGDIGGEGDPGRLAERTFSKRDADTEAVAGRPRETEVKEEGVGYKALDTDASA